MSSSPRNGLWILFAMTLGSAVVYLNATMVNFALPSLQENLGLSATGSRWILQAYSLILASLILVGGSLGDRLGRERMWMVGVGILAFASLGGAFASNLSLLLAARVAQGVGGALIIPASLAIISNAWGGVERAKSIGTWAGFTAMSSAGGPVIGGFLVDRFDWRMVFLINVPIAALVMAIAWKYVPDSHDPEITGRPDWPGGVVTAIALSGAVLGFSEIAQVGWPNALSIGAFAAAVVALVTFLFLERRATDPMIKVALFRSRVFSGANTLMALVYGALGLLLYLLPFNLTEVQGYTDTQAGLAMLPYVLIMAAGSRWSGGMVDRVGPRLPMTIGPIIVAVGYVLFSIFGRNGSYWTSIFPAATVVGIGMMITVAPMLTVVMSSVERRQGGLAAGVNNGAARAGNVLVIAVASVMMVGMFETNLERELESVDVRDETRTELLESSSQLAELEPPDGLAPDQEEDVSTAINSSFLSGFERVMWVNVLLAVAGAMIAAFTIPGKLAEASDETSEEENAGADRSVTSPV